MDCDEALSRVAGRIGRGDGAAEDDAALREHLAGCAECAATMRAASEAGDALRRLDDAASADPVPPTRAESLVPHVRRRRSPARRILRSAARAAVLLLSVAGAAALAGVELRPRDPAPQITPADVERAARLAADDVVARIESKLVARIDESAAEGAASWQSALRDAEESRREDTAVIVDAIVALRRDLAASALGAPGDPTAGLPRLPDVR